MDRSNSNLAVKFPELLAHFFEFPAVFPGFFRVFPAFSTLVSGHFWTIVIGQSPSHLPVNLGHFGHSLGYFREIYDRNIRVNSLEILGTGGSIWPQNPGSLTWITWMMRLAFYPCIMIIGTARSWPRVAGPVRRKFSGGPIGWKRAGRTYSPVDQILGPLRSFESFQV